MLLRYIRDVRAVYCPEGNCNEPLDLTCTRLDLKHFGNCQCMMKKIER